MTHTLSPDQTSRSLASAHPGTEMSHRPARPLTVVLAVVGVAVVAGAVNVAVSRLALLAGASATFGALRVSMIIPATLVGVLIATAGWLIIRARARRSSAILRIAVPVALVASFTPDLTVLLTHALPGVTTVGIAALMFMHVVIVAIAVPVLARVAPTRCGPESVRTNA